MCSVSTVKNKKIIQLNWSNESERIGIKSIQALLNLIETILEITSPKSKVSTKVS